MSDELLKVVCGQCDGKMRVRKTGQAVVCPHCGSHLRVPENASVGSKLAVESGSGVLDRVASRSGVLRKSDSAPGLSNRKATAPAPSGVSRNLFLIVASYASAVTLVCLWLLFSSRSHQLESLPDVRTLSAGELKFVSYDAELPSGHTLTLNESRRFGDVRVTPVKVTREEIGFVHYDDPTQPSPDETDPVLKLWLKFENMSDDVTFPPYDIALMSHRVVANASDLKAKANTFLARADTKRTPESVLLNFDHSLESDWLLKDQALAALGPGLQCTTFVASEEEGVDELTAEADQLLWRVQFRKGVNRTSRRGVTTLIDVVFSRDDIQ